MTPALWYGLLGGISMAQRMNAGQLSREEMMGLELWRQLPEDWL